MAGMSGHKKSPLNMSSINRALRGELITVNVSTANVLQEIHIAKFYEKNLKTCGVKLFSVKPPNMPRPDCLLCLEEDFTIKAK